jgi:CCR4-NOT transcription complex subunit 2
VCDLSIFRYARQWRYHKELSVWLTKDPGVEPIEKGPNYERGTYIIFDPAVFSRVETPKDFTLQYDLLEDRPVIVPPPALLQQVQQGQNQPQGQQQAQQTPQPANQQQQAQGQAQTGGQQAQEAKR